MPRHLFRQMSSVTTAGQLAYDGTQPQLTVGKGLKRNRCRLAPDSQVPSSVVTLGQVSSEVSTVCHSSKHIAVLQEQISSIFNQLRGLGYDATLAAAVHHSIACEKTRRLKTGEKESAKQTSVPALNALPPIIIATESRDYAVVN